MQLTIKPMTAVLLGIAFAFAFAFLLNGKDYSPSKSVATVAHSTVSTTSDSAWQNNRAQLDRPGPEQVTIQQPPTVIVQLPEGVYPPATNSSGSDDLSASDVGSSGTGWRTPKATPTDTTEESAADSSDDTYANEARTQGLTDCDALAQRIHDTHDYRGTADERACFGEEDDDRVGLALDYGVTAETYAANESRGGGSASNPHPGYATCANEDSPGPCAWDAQARGNGSGHSFLREANGSITYLSSGQSS